jgi:hypothetical protein
MKSAITWSYDPIPGTAAPLIGISGCAGGGGGSGGVIRSPLQDSRTARQAIGIVVILIDLPEALRTRLTAARNQKDARSGMDDPWAGGRMR